MKDSNSEDRSESSIHNVTDDTEIDVVNTGDREKIGNCSNSVNSPRPPPNGGLVAWSQVFAGFFCLFNSWGVVTAFGTYQNYYKSSLLKDESPSNISWIGGIQAFMVVGVSVLTGRLLDAGYLRPILLFGTFMLCFGLMMASLATEFYQLLLSQGFCAGIGCSCFYSSGIATVAPYFSPRRATAIGIIAAGSSIGGVVYPIMVQQLIPKIGFAWTTRAIAFMLLGISVCPCVVLRSYVPPRKSGPLIDVPSLTDWPFVLFTFGTMFSFIGLYVPLFYVASFAQTTNVQRNVANNIVSIFNAGSVFGRILPNFLADRIGPLNILIPATLCATVLSFCWIAVDSTGGMVAFAILYGFFSGSLVSIPGSVVSTITKDMSKLGTRLGMNFGVCSIGVLVGGPAAGAIINRMNGSYLGAQVFSGVATIFGSSLLIVSRLLMTNGKLKAKA